MQPAHSAQNNPAEPNPTQSTPGRAVPPQDSVTAAALPTHRDEADAAALKEAAPEPHLAFGLALVAISLFFLAFSLTIRRGGLAGDTDPGPRALPLLLATGLLIGGAIEVIRGCRQGWPTRTSPSFSPQAVTDQVGNRATFGLLVSLLVYLLALPWLGFAVSTWLFSTFLLWLLQAKWWVAGGISLIFVVTILLIFTGLFQVPLPSGAWSTGLW